MVLVSLVRRCFGILAPIALGGLLLLLALEPSAGAQSCDRPLCRSGERYTRSGTDSAGPYGVCESGPRPFTRARSHYLARCEEGRTLNFETGQCVLDACLGGGACGAQAPLCDSGERYTRSERDAEGVYGVCNHGPAPVTRAESHQIKRCREGWTLVETTGMCRRDCLFVITEIDPGVIVTLLRPDLTIRRSALASPSGQPIRSVIARKPYYACFEVANEGGAASGPFRVAGGGLGVPTAPSQAHATLAPGESRQACLYYERAPEIGRYRLGLKVDSLDTVTESREDNNTAEISVIVRR